MEVRLPAPRIYIPASNAHEIARGLILRRNLASAVELVAPGLFLSAIITWSGIVGGA